MRRFMCWLGIHVTTTEDTGARCPNCGTVYGEDERES